MPGDNYPERTLPLWHHLSSTFPTVDEHQLMQSDACVAAVHHFLVEQLIAHRADQKSSLSTVELSADAIRKYLSLTSSRVRFSPRDDSGRPVDELRCRLARASPHGITRRASRASQNGAPVWITGMAFLCTGRTTLFGWS